MGLFNGVIVLDRVDRMPDSFRKVLTGKEPIMAKKTPGSSSSSASSSATPPENPRITKVKSLIEQIQGERQQLVAQRDEIDAQIREIDVLLGKTETPVDSGTRRGKRTNDQLKADAAKIVEFLRKNPGSKAGAISEATGVDYGQSLSDFVEKYADVKLGKEGEKAGTVYSLP